MNKKHQQNHIINSPENLTLVHNPEAEKATVAAMLIETTAVYEVIDFLKPEMFYNKFLQQAYEAILAVESKSKVDIVTVSEEMKKRNDKANLYELAMLSGEMGSAAHIWIHARIVYQDFKRRQLALACAKTLAESNDLSIDVADLIDYHMASIEDVSNTTIENETVSISKVAVESYKGYEERARKAKEGVSIGVHTGLNVLDKALHGFQKGCMYILAARPAMGKTAFMLNIARKTAKHGNKVFIVSLEMTRRSLVDRMIIAESGINASEYRSGNLSQDEFLSMAQSQENISLLPIEINDTPLMSVQQIKAQAKKLKRQNKLDIILIDYLQLIDMPRMQSRDNEVSATTRSIKVMAKELEVPVVLLSQLNREVERRSDKVPMLSDLRESGAIEQDADAVLFIHRESYYNDQADRDKGIIRLAKNREERTGDVEFWVNENITDFRDYPLQNPISSIQNNQFSKKEEDLPF